VLTGPTVQGRECFDEDTDLAVPLRAMLDSNMSCEVSRLSQSEPCTTTVTVIDTTPPVIVGLTPTQAQLWPPNGAMVPITVSAAVADNCSATTTSEIISVTSNEPETGGADSTSPDSEITGPLSVNLRAERLDSGVGRVYSITVRCTDEVGNSSQRVTTVTVPKNQKRKNAGEF
jgi:hypothetical protein